MTKKNEADQRIDELRKELELERLRKSKLESEVTQLNPQLQKFNKNNNNTSKISSSSSSFNPSSLYPRFEGNNIH